MKRRPFQLEEELREELAEVMLKALKDEGGIFPTEQEHYKLKEAFMDALRGNLRI